MIRAATEAIAISFEAGAPSNHPGDDDVAARCMVDVFVYVVRDGEVITELLPAGPK
jgi:hypothetical protein